MRKYVIGILIGFCLSFVVGAYAEEVGTTVKNIIGQPVSGQFPLTINGVKNAEPAAVIDINGEPKGYVPIRVVSEALGVEITFDADLGIFVNGTPKSVTEATYKAERRKAISEKTRELQAKNEQLLIKLNENLLEQNIQRGVYMRYENSIYLAENSNKIKDSDVPIYEAAKKKFEQLQVEDRQIRLQRQVINDEINAVQSQLNE